MLRHAVLGFCVAFFSVGCTHVPTVRVVDADRYAAEGSKFSGHATVYVFRGSSQAGAVWPFAVDMDDKSIGSIRRERYLAFPATAGHHVVGVTCSSLCGLPGWKADMDVTAGRTYYFIVEPGIQFGGGPFGPSVRASSSLSQIDKLYADRLMKTYEEGKFAEPQ